MREKVKSKLVDLAFLILAIVVVLGGLHLYNRLEAHNQLVESLVNVLRTQQKQMESRPQQRMLTPPPAEQPQPEKK